MTVYAFADKVCVQIYDQDGLHSYSFEAGEHEVSDVDVAILHPFVGVIMQAVPDAPPAVPAPVAAPAPVVAPVEVPAVPANADVLPN